ncbi:MAG: TolC family protein [Myxococcales bacterium]
MKDGQPSWVWRMGIGAATVGCVLGGWAQQLAHGQEPNAPFPSEEGQEVTLDDALRSAFERHPDLRAAYASVQEARGGLVGARAYPFNPNFLAFAGSRTGMDDGSVDVGLQLNQQVEIAGQRRRRMHTAEAVVEAESATWRREARLLAARVHVTFINALEARKLLEIANADVELTEHLFDFATKRLERGAATQLEVNLAATEFGRSRGRAQLAQGLLEAAGTELGRAMAVNPAAPPTPKGELEVPKETLPPLDDLVAGALRNRADLEAFRAFEQSSEERLRLARSEAAPDITLRGYWKREGPEKIIGGGGNIAIPLFQRNQGPIAQSKGAVSRTRAQRESAELAVTQETAATRARFQAAAASARQLEEIVLGSLQQNLELLQKSLEAGKTTWAEVLIIRRSLIDARRELVNAQAEAGRAWIQLQLATAQLPIPKARQEASR